ATDCKSVQSGSTPDRASKNTDANQQDSRHRSGFFVIRRAMSAQKSVLLLPEFVALLPLDGFIYPSR
ncbi:MAG TPA: hypothetical protein PLW80_05565, partial [Spirochaetales bacterium]|nr:hypothetical protein [Spirochaetales bacterium]